MVEELASVRPPLRLTSLDAHPMPGRVFISCGQATTAERGVASKLSAAFKRRGFTPYVAIAAQTIEDVNSGIIGRLKTSDYYVFVDFRRDKVRGGYRGSFSRTRSLRPRISSASSLSSCSSRLA